MPRLDAAIQREGGASPTLRADDERRNYQARLTFSSPVISTDAQTLASVISTGAQRSGEIWPRPRHTFRPEPDSSTALGMTASRRRPWRGDRSTRDRTIAKLRLTLPPKEKEGQAPPNALMMTAFGRSRVGSQSVRPLCHVRFIYRRIEDVHIVSHTLFEKEIAPCPRRPH
jgi:hypothetical protein